MATAQSSTQPIIRLARILERLLPGTPGHHNTSLIVLANRLLPQLRTRERTTAIAVLDLIDPALLDSAPTPAANAALDAALHQLERTDPTGFAFLRGVCRLNQVRFNA